MKIQIIAGAGIILIIVGLILQIIQEHKEINNLNERIDIVATENAKLKAENEHLWDNYYMNVTNQEGYEYYE